MGNLGRVPDTQLQTDLIVQVVSPASVSAITVSLGLGA